MASLRSVRELDIKAWAKRQEQGALSKYQEPLVNSAANIRLIRSFEIDVQDRIARIQNVNRIHEVLHWMRLSPPYELGREQIAPTVHLLKLRARDRVCDLIDLQLKKVLGLSGRSAMRCLEALLRDEWEQLRGVFPGLYAELRRIYKLLRERILREAARPVAPRQGGRFDY